MSTAVLLLIVASIAFFLYQMNALAKEIKKLIKQAESAISYAEAWQAKALDYRRKWHEADTDSREARDDRKAHLQVQDGKVIAVYTASAPAFLFKENVE